MKSWLLTGCVLGLVVLMAGTACGQGRGFGRGGAGRGGAGQGGAGQRGVGRGHDERHDADREVFQFLLANHEKIKRTVTRIETGVETLTESDDKAIAEKIQEHAHWMQVRVEKGQPIRMRDPLFAALFRNYDKIAMKVENTEKGVRVVETSDDPDVVRLIQAHADTVSKFVERGFAEAMKNHPVPGTESDDFSYSNPKISNYGKVVTLPNADQQPRSGSKIVVDVTQGGEPNQLNAAIEKVARFVNIYAGAGKEEAEVEIAIVLHGEATLAALSPEAYATRFETDGNPNLDCLHELHEAGVLIYVCGQSLAGEGAKPEETAVFVDVAVSALTTLVNLQADGFSYVPLGK